jgi:glutathione S-transferase
LGQSEVQKWLSIAAGPLVNGPASARLVTLFGAKLNAADLIARSHALLKVMEATLSRRDFLALNRPTIADIANYTYVAHAPEGNVSLDEYPNICAWLLRIEQLPGFIPFTRSLVGLQAIA